LEVRLSFFEEIAILLKIFLQSGITNPSINTIKKLAKALVVYIDDLLK
jgi:hypothetical protein